jgi:hypothetical protein
MIAVTEAVNNDHVFDFCFDDWLLGQNVGGNVGLFAAGYCEELERLEGGSKAWIIGQVVPDPH